MTALLVIKLLAAVLKEAAAEYAEKKSGTTDYFVSWRSVRGFLFQRVTIQNHLEEEKKLCHACMGRSEFSSS